MTIPIATRSAIRAYGAVDLSSANYSDEEIEAIVEEIDWRIKKYQSTDNKRAKQFASLSNSICYGTADLP